LKKEAATKPNDTQRISAKEYVRVLRDLSLSSITLTSCDTAVDWDVAKGIDITSIPPTITDAVELERENGAVIVRHRYNVTAKRGRKRLFYLKAEFAVKLAVPEGFNEDFFNQFRVTSLPLVTWPYLRQLVGYMTEQMGLPRLHLGLWKTPFS